MYGRKEGLTAENTESAEKIKKWIPASAGMTRIKEQ